MHASLINQVFVTIALILYVTLGPCLVYTRIMLYYGDINFISSCYFWCLWPIIFLLFEKKYSFTDEITPKRRTKVFLL